MSQDNPIPSTFAEWIVRSLDGTITPEQFALLEQEITTNSKARAYYLEFITTYVSLMDLVGSLPKAESLVDGPQTRRTTSPNIAECPAPKKGRENAGGIRVEPGTSEEDRIREIERIANRKLAEFLAQEQQGQSRVQITTGGRDLWSAICGTALGPGWSR
jgi:hypothetical protein